MTKQHRNRFMAIFAAGLISLNIAKADDHIAVNQIQTRVGELHIPGKPLRNFDISIVDESRDIYALSDRSNHGIDLINTQTGSFLGRIGGFAGAGHGSGGPNGLVIGDHGQLWAGDGNSTIKVVDIKAKKVISAISTGGKGRVDELAYDHEDHIVIAANDEDKPPFLTFISDNQGYKVIGHLKLEHATNGLEQPVWDPKRNLFYVAIPEIDGIAEQGAIAVIDPHTRNLTRLIPVQKCMPAGMALGKKDHLVVGCSDDAVKAGYSPKTLIIDPQGGTIVSTFYQVGGSDEVWYDGRKYYLAAVSNKGGPVVGIIDAESERWTINIPTGPHSHSVAADAASRRIYVPLAAGKDNKVCTSGCIAVYAPD